MLPPESTSTRPYLVRALYEWCTDNGLTPYVAVRVDDSVQVPREFVKNNEIVLNISFDATSSLQLGNDFIQFNARFSGSPREIIVPMTHVMAIYARENGQGLSFPDTALGGAPADEQLEPRLSSIAGDEKSDIAPKAQSGSATPGRDEKIMQLVADSTAFDDATPTDETDPPKPPTRSRPSLVRVK